MTANSRHADVRHLVQALVDAYTPRLGLADWRINVRWIDDPEAEKAGCYAEPEYLQAELTFNARVDWSALALARLREYVVHELVHCLTWSIARCGEALGRTEAEREWHRDKHEELVERICRWPVWQDVTGEP